jgi:hypothetical protein
MDRYARSCRMDYVEKRARGFVSVVSLVAVVPIVLLTGNNLREDVLCNLDKFCFISSIKNQDCSLSL